MPILTEEILRESLVLAQRIRICELEGDLRQVAESLQRAERAIREVLASGASLDEQLRASVSLGETQALLRDALSRPSAPEKMRCTARPTRDSDELCRNLALPGKTLCGGAHLFDSDIGGAPGGAGEDHQRAEPGAPHLCKVLPLRRDLGVRFRGQGTVYEQSSAGESLHATSRADDPEGA
jgi:hypothetical protein